MFSAKPKNKKKIVIKQIIYAIFSIILMLFILSQVYFLARYTLGYKIDTNKLVIYKLINKIDQRQNNKNYTVKGK